MKQKKQRRKVKKINWKQKADILWSLIIRLRSKQCQVCGKKAYITKKGLLVGGMNAHHIIGRGNWLFRHDLNNGHCLCVGCHKLIGQRSPHAGSIVGITAYVDWFKDNCPKQWAWFDEHKYEKGKPPKPFEDIFHELEKRIANKDYWP